MELTLAEHSRLDKHIVKLINKSNNDTDRLQAVLKILRHKRFVLVTGGENNDN